MRRKFGRYTTLGAAIALACGAAWAQDENVHEGPVADERIGVGHEDERALEDEQELAEQRRMLEQAAQSAIAELRATYPESGQVLDAAYGYAVFDTTEGGLIVTGSGGSGIAQVKDGGDQTFMHVAGAGIGLGAGGENYKLVLVFPDQSTYDDFVDGAWEAGASAQAAAGDEGAGAAALTDDIQVYHLTDQGLIAQADVTGLRFWPSEDLNRTDVASVDDEREIR